MKHDCLMVGLIEGKNNRGMLWKAYPCFPYSILANISYDMEKGIKNLKQEIYVSNGTLIHRRIESRARLNQPSNY